MKKFFAIGLLIIVVIILGYVLVNEARNGDSTGPRVENLTLYENVAPDFSFSYDGSENGYEIFSPKPDNSATGGSEKSLVVVSKKEYNELLLSEGAREGPPTINIIYFKNPNALTPLEWVEQDAGFTDFNQRRLSNIVETKIDEIPAIEFVADGLYASRVVVTAHQGRIFMFIGSFISEDDKISKDFNSILESFGFDKSAV